MGTQKFENMTPVAYQTIRDSIKTGDIFLASGDYELSRMIRHFSDSDFSHVGVIFTWNSRVMLLESVEIDGVRMIPLSQYVNNYNNSGKGYDGRLFIGRYKEGLEETTVNSMIGCAFDLLHKKYDIAELGRILQRITKIGHVLEKLFHESGHIQNDAYICSEFVDACFQKAGILFPRDEEGYIFPEHIADDPNVSALYEIINNR